MQYFNRRGHDYSSRSNEAPIVIDGLGEFFKTLEKDFFAEISLQGLYHDHIKKADLIVEIFCNFSITEAFRHFKEGDWGGAPSEKKKKDAGYSFNKAFEKLQQDNDNPVDVTEISFHFDDTSVVISRMYDHSIPKQLNAILSEMSNHLVYITKAETQIPYEIFIPVFENTRRRALSSINSPISYFEYWGVYIEGDDDKQEAMVYNLKTKQLHSEDFLLL